MTYLTFIFGTEFTGTEFTGTKFTGTEFTGHRVGVSIRVLNDMLIAFLNLTNIPILGIVLLTSYNSVCALSEQCLVKMSPNKSNMVLQSIFPFPVANYK